MRRFTVTLALAALIGVFAAPAAYAQQSVNFWVGGFVPSGESTRGHNTGASDDVLVNNLDFLAFNIHDFNGGTVGGDWLVRLGEHFDAGLGLGFYQSTTPSVYRFFTNADGSEIEQNLRLRVVPFTATIRFMPLPREAIVQPYIGTGIGVFSWTYTETGQFVDFNDFSIFRDRFNASGAAAGPVVLGGVNVPIGSGGVGFEMRYQSAEGKLPGDLGFSAPRIDLGGFNYLATIR